MIHKFLLFPTLIVVLFFQSQSAKAQATVSGYYSIGPRFTYNFGSNEGWAYGFEVTYVLPFAEKASVLSAVTFALCVPPDSGVSFHFGYEPNVVVAGIDIGPTVTLRSGVVYPAISVITWLGGFVFVAGDFTTYFSSKIQNYTSLGAYVKFRLGKGWNEVTQIGN